MHLIKSGELPIGVRVIEFELSSDWNSYNFQFAGGMAGVNSWVISYPADVVKTRIQAQHMDKPALYKNFFHGLECFKKEWIQSISTNADEV